MPAVEKCAASLIVNSSAVFGKVSSLAAGSDDVIELTSKRHESLKNSNSFSSERKQPLSSSLSSRSCKRPFSGTPLSVLAMQPTQSPMYVARHLSAEVSRPAKHASG